MKKNIILTLGLLGLATVAQGQSIVLKNVNAGQVMIDAYYGAVCDKTSINENESTTCNFQPWTKARIQANRTDIAGGSWCNYDIYSTEKTAVKITLQGESQFSCSPTPIDNTFLVNQ